MASAKDIRFDQRNVTNTAYQERYVNGNSLIIRTDSTGSVVGVSSLEGVAIGLTSPSTANFTSVTATSVSSSTIIGNLSGSLSGSNITVNSITSSNISASGYISASNSNFATSSGQILEYNQITASSLVVFDNTTLGNSVNDIIRVTGSLSLSGSTSTNSSSFVDLTANRVVYTNQNQILTTDDDLIFDGNALTASNLLSNNVDINGGTIDGTTIGLTSATTAKFTEITASNISASGNISSSTADFNILTSNSSILFNVTSSNISASGYISSSTLHTINLVSENNILTNITSSNISASGNISSSTANINTITSNLINSVSGSFSNISASKITGGTTQLDTLSVLGNSTFYGDLTVYGSSSIVNISSSTVIIGDNRIQLNAWSTGSFSQRYAGLDLTDSGSSNTVTSSLLWDSLNNYWLLTNNQTGSNPTVTSSALIIQGPISDFGSEKQLPINTFLKVESAIGNLTSSNLTEVGSLLTYNGTVSSSAVSASSGFFSLDVLINGVLQVFSKIYAYAGIIGDVTGSLSGSSVITNTLSSSQINSTNIVTNTLSASAITSSMIKTGNATIDGGTINNTIIGNITPTTGNFTSITSSVISSSILISNYNTLLNVTSSNISASGYISASSANFSNLTSINNLLTNITASNISASNNLSASNIYVENTINADTGSFVYFNINNTGSAPTNYTSSGSPGEIRFDNNFIYIYTNNRWVRSPISKWD